MKDEAKFTLKVAIQGAAIVGVWWLADHYHEAAIDPTDGQKKGGFPLLEFKPYPMFVVGLLLALVYVMNAFLDTTFSSESNGWWDRLK